MNTRTIVCGADSSPGGRAAVRVAASMAAQLDAHLIVVHVLDRIATDSQTAERTAATILYDEAPDAGAEARGEIGDDRGAAGSSRARRNRRADRHRRPQSWPLAHNPQSPLRGRTRGAHERPGRRRTDAGHGSAGRPTRRRLAGSTRDGATTRSRSRPGSETLASIATSTKRATQRRNDVQEIVITRDGLERLEAELERLTTEGRREIAERLETRGCQRGEPRRERRVPRRPRGSGTTRASGSRCWQSACSWLR